MISKIKINGKKYSINGNSAFIRYSANADGTDFTKERSEGQNYIGFATGKVAPTVKEGYQWVGVGGSGGKVDKDWNENNANSPSYIQNRTHYITTSEKTGSFTMVMEQDTVYEDLSDKGFPITLEVKGDNIQPFTVVVTEFPERGRLHLYDILDAEGYAYPAKLFVTSDKRLGLEPNEYESCHCEITYTGTVPDFSKLDVGYIPVGEVLVQGMIENPETLTEEQQALAQKWLGVDTAIQDAINSYDAEAMALLGEDEVQE